MKKYSVLCAVVILLGALCTSFPVQGAPSANLLSRADSYMESPYNGWYPFQEGNLRYSTGENPYLIFETVPGKNWCSPALNLGSVPMGGVFQLDYDIYLVSKYNVTSLNNVIRSKNQLSLSTAYNSSTDSYYGSIGRLQAKTNQWVHFTTTFGIKNDESYLLARETMFCFDNLAQDITFIYLDNVELRLLDYTYTATMQPIDKEFGELNPTPVPTPRLSSSPPQAPTMPPTMPPTLPPAPATPDLPSPAAPTAALPTRAPRPTVAGEGENLLEAVSSSFEEIEPGVEIAWVKKNGTLTIDENGYEGSCLTLQDTAGSSPYLRLSKYITAPGLYTVSLMVRVAAQPGTEAVQPSLTVQSSIPGKLFSSSEEGRYFADIAVAPQAMEPNEWYKFSGTFAVEEVPAENAQWMLFFSDIPAGVTMISVDNVSLMRDGLKDTKTPEATAEEKVQAFLLPIGWIIGLGSLGAVGIICLVVTLILLGVKHGKNRKSRADKENDEVSKLFE